MSERTFLSFLLFGVRKDNSNSIPQVFANGLSQLLEIEGFSDDQIEKVFSEYQQCELTKTNNRSALGNLRDLMLNYEHAIMYEGGLKHCNLGEIIHGMNRMPQSNLDWKFSINVARDLINSSNAS